MNIREHLVTPILARYLFVVVLSFSLTAQTGQSTRVAILEPGVFHGQDVALQQPVMWIGMFCTGQSCEAHQTKIRSSRAPDPLGEDEPNKPTGTSIEVLSRRQPLFLVHGLAAPEGRVVTAFVGEHNLSAGSEQTFTLKQQSFTLRINGKPTDDEQIPKGSRLTLTDGTLIQELFSLPNGGNDPYVTVLWIGDIDGDGKPDLYINASDHYNVANKVLWLSSLAKSGQLVGPTAAFVTVGC